jgi:hypothetical protein
MCEPRVTRHTSTRYSTVNGRPLDFCSHRHPFSVNCLYHTQMVLSVGRSFAYFACNAHCTVTTDLTRDIPTHKMTSPPEQPFSHYVHSHRLAAEMWTTMKNKLTGKKFLSCFLYLYRFCKYVSYGFPIINFCNPGVHYETPCIRIKVGVSSAVMSCRQNSVFVQGELIERHYYVHFCETSCQSNNITMKLSRSSLHHDSVGCPTRP